jgi:hypothetical protein
VLCRRDFKDKLIAVPGNHEYDSLEEKDGKPTKDRRPTHDAAPFFDHFKNYAFVRRCDEKDVLTNERLPEDECAKRWYKKGYFAFNFPDSGSPWRIVALNDNLAGPRLKAQTQWLEQQLDIAKGNDQRCVLAFWHAPVFSSGQHGHKDYRHPRPKAKLSAPGRMQEILGILHRHGASVVLQGHDHDYEQFNPHDSAGRPASDGIRSFVIGTGGAGLTKDFYVPEGWAATSDRGPFGHDRGRHGVLKIDLYQDGYSWEFLQVETHGRRDIPGGPPFVPCNQRKTPPANAPSPR